MECKVNSGNMKEAIFFLKRKNIFYGNASTSFTFLSLGSMSDAIFVALSSTKISPAKFYYVIVYRRCHWICSLKKGVLKNFTKFTGKHLQGDACNFIKKETLAQVFFCEFFAKFLRTTTLWSTSVRLLFTH